MICPLDPRIVAKPVGWDFCSVRSQDHSAKIRNIAFFVPKCPSGYHALGMYYVPTYTTDEADYKTIDDKFRCILKSATEKYTTVSDPFLKSKQPVYSRSGRSHNNRDLALYSGHYRE